MRAPTLRRLSVLDLAHAANLTLACMVSYGAIQMIFSGLVDASLVPLGGTWAAVSTIFVLRDSRAGSLSAGLARLLATCVSFVLCLGYLLLFPASFAGLAALLCLGALVMAALDRRDDIIATDITTCVIMTVAASHPSQAWLHPPLRFLDTVVGIAIGVAFRWAGDLLLRRSGAPAAVAPGPSP
ncbi:FUSC family protein [Dankookia sp. P2]|uniref:FUSC family protein n=1 Tax=Dankookia sp. P2 TaxID=3423955 RepID=UPI003D66A623